MLPWLPLSHCETSFLSIYPCMSYIALVSLASRSLNLECMSQTPRETRNAAFLNISILHHARTEKKILPSTLTREMILNWLDTKDSFSFGRKQPSACFHWIEWRHSSISSGIAYAASGLTLDISCIPCTMYHLDLGLMLIKSSIPNFSLQTNTILFSLTHIYQYIRLSAKRIPRPWNE